MRQVNVAVAVITNSKGKILLTQRNSPEQKNIHLKWQLPGGEVEKKEGVRHACIREVQEETGLNIKLVSDQQIICAPYGEVEYVLHGFKARIESGTIDVTLDRETADAKWFLIDEIRGLSTLKFTTEMIEASLKK